MTIMDAERLIHVDKEKQTIIEGEWQLAVIKVDDNGIIQDIQNGPEEDLYRGEPPLIRFQESIEEYQRKLEGLGWKIIFNSPPLKETLPNGKTVIVPQVDYFIIRFLFHLKLAETRQENQNKLEISGRL